MKGIKILEDSFLSNMTSKDEHKSHFEAVEPLEVLKSHEDLCDIRLLLLCELWFVVLYCKYYIDYERGFTFEITFNDQIVLSDKK